jgi:D-glycero-alpha-D-manno-heptose 1-phosphate guanylyltransferase
MKAVVLAGGFGTRLKSRIADVPKPMAPVAGRPLLELVLDNLLGSGVDRIVLSVGYKSDVIRAHFGSNYRGLTIDYSVEATPLGTGGAVALALNGTTEPSLVLNGDTLLDINYQHLLAWYGQAPSPAAVVLRQVPDTSRYGSVLLSNDHVLSFQEKGKHGPGWINAGVYIIRPGLFEAYGLTGAFALESDFLQKHCSQVSIRAYTTDAYFIDIGVPADYEKAQIELSGRI